MESVDPETGEVYLPRPSWWSWLKGPRQRPRPAVREFCVYCATELTPGFAKKHDPWCPRWESEEET